MNTGWGASRTYAASAIPATKPIKQRPREQLKSQLPDSAAGLVNAMSALFLTYVSLNITKMSKTELSVELPADFQPELWERLNAKLMKVLEDAHEIDPTSDECCGWLFYEFLTARQIADVAVKVFGNDMPYTKRLVTNLRLIGNGDCPNCGANDRADITGNIRNEETYGTFFEIVGHKCNRCNHIDYR
jgi:hypothetical protein